MLRHIDWKTLLKGFGIDILFTFLVGIVVGMCIGIWWGSMGGTAETLRASPIISFAQAIVGLLGSGVAAYYISWKSKEAKNKNVIAYAVFLSALSVLSFPFYFLSGNSGKIGKSIAEIIATILVVMLGGYIQAAFAKKKRIKKI